MEALIAEIMQLGLSYHLGDFNGEHFCRILGYSKTRKNDDGTPFLDWTLSQYKKTPQEALKVALDEFKRKT